MPTTPSATKRKTGKASARKTPYDKAGAGTKDRLNPYKKPSKSTKRTYSKASSTRKSK